jgi:hypothetical protein
MQSVGGGLQWTNTDTATHTCYVSPKILYPTWLEGAEVRSQSQDSDLIPR